MCMGFHVGWFLYIIFGLTGYDLFPNFWIGLIPLSAASSGVSYFLISIVSDYGLKIHHYYNDDGTN